MKKRSNVTEEKPEVAYDEEEDGENIPSEEEEEEEEEDERKQQKLLEAISCLGGEMIQALKRVGLLQTHRMV